MRIVVVPVAVFCVIRRLAEVSGVEAAEISEQLKAAEAGFPFLYPVKKRLGAVKNPQSYAYDIGDSVGVGICLDHNLQRSKVAAEIRLHRDRVKVANRRRAR